MTSVSATEIELGGGGGGGDGGSCIMSGTTYQGDIPPSFDANVFEKAYDDIRYLVLTNTWPKYVREWRSSSDAGSTGSDGHRDGVIALGGGGGDGSASSAGGRIKNKSKRSTTASAATISEKGSSWSLKGGISRALGIKA